MNCVVCNKELTGKQTKYCSKYCQKLGEHRRRRGHAEGVRPIRSHIKWTDEEIQDRINTKSDKIIYLGGYVDDKSKIYLMCKDCGSTFTRLPKILRPSSNSVPQCDYCNSLLQSIKENKRQARLQEAEEQKARIKAERELQKILSHYRICKRCGKQFQADRNQVYCSKLCAKRQANSDKEHLRRIRIKSKPHDTISLELLYKRDNGKCWICNRLCDWNDKYIKNGAQVTGQNHPSIDHVVALSIGGTHTWDNVRLAHMKCNTDKSNKIYIAGTDSQLRLVL